jgi:hypothetical protein
MPIAKTKTRTKPKPPSRKVQDKAQYERFVEAAREAGVDEDPEVLDRALERIVPPKRP